MWTASGEPWPIDDLDDGWTKREGEAARRLDIFRYYVEEMTPEDVAAIGRNRGSEGMTQQVHRDDSSRPSELI